MNDKNAFTQKDFKFLTMIKSGSENISVIPLDRQDILENEQVHQPIVKEFVK